ncbi:MAG TPA: hypothetical protein DDZ80_29935, partial [Cyanobacteria bacterium UBA8803]|nr:hypothetical protein [Cyanobacteria bacterium UBA8803]
VVSALSDRGIEFKSLQESIDTSTPGGKLIFHVFCAIAEFERDLACSRPTPSLPRFSHCDGSDLRYKQ